MTRTETAESIAISVRVFVRKARSNGCTNMVTDLAIQETAQNLGIHGDAYSMRTVWMIVRRDSKAAGEMAMISKPGISGR